MQPTDEFPVLEGLFGVVVGGLNEGGCVNFLGKGTLQREAKIDGLDRILIERNDDEESDDKSLSEKRPEQNAAFGPQAAHDQPNVGNELHVLMSLASGQSHTLSAQFAPTHFTTPRAG